MTAIELIQWDKPTSKITLKNKIIINKIIPVPSIINKRAFKLKQVLSEIFTYISTIEFGKSLLSLWNEARKRTKKKKHAIYFNNNQLVQLKHFITKIQPSCESINELESITDDHPTNSKRGSLISILSSTRVVLFY